MDILFQSSDSKISKNILKICVEIEREKEREKRTNDLRQRVHIRRNDDVQSLSYIVQTETQLKKKEREREKKTKFPYREKKKRRVKANLINFTCEQHQRTHAGLFDRKQH